MKYKLHLAQYCNQKSLQAGHLNEVEVLKHTVTEGSGLNQVCIINFNLWLHIIKKKLSLLQPLTPPKKNKIKKSPKHY